jgi:predicted amidohydrolase YtcJ
MAVMNALLTNARIYTVNRHQPRADSIAISHDRILAVGTAAELDGIRLPDMQRIDMQGAFILPGLIDAHVHLQLAGYALRRVNLWDVPSAAACVQRVAERARSTPAGAWIEGSGWQQGDWSPPIFPTAADLDAVTPNHPVALRARSWHAVWANTLAMRIAGVTRDTPNPPGGEIVRDDSGEPTGVFLENAGELILRAIPDPTPADEEDATVEAMRAMNAAGLTQVHCMDGQNGIKSFKTYQRVRESGRATLRISKQIPVQSLDEAIALGLRSGMGDSWLRLGGTKIFVDGALGPKTAWMAAPYPDNPANTGIWIYTPEQLHAFTDTAHRNGISITVHAIGDRANHEVLNAIAASRAVRPVGRLRDRIEHCQALLPADIPRFQQLEVIASTQPIHATADMQVADAHWGPSVTPYAYANRSLWDSGARMAFGSDMPVETFDPLKGIHAAITRTRADRSHAPDGWHNEQRLTIDQALYGYTLGAAYAGYMDHETGSLEPGKLADMTVLSHDLTDISPDDILNVNVLHTILAGAPIGAPIGAWTSQG